jgi:choline dehydrogenase-like flavoprotein
VSEKETFEYVIVGSGVAATTVARKLLRKRPGASILVLEAGPRIPAKVRRHWWDHAVLNRQPYTSTYDNETKGDKEFESSSVGNTRWGFRESRVRAYGGSTMHWGGWCLRFKPEDFKVKSATGEGGDWPFSYDDLEPHYAEAEQFLSVCGDADEGWMPRSTPYPLPPFWWTESDGEMIEGFLRNGIKPGKMPVARYRKCMTTGTCKYCPIGGRFTAQSVLDELETDPRHTGLQVRTGAVATRLLLADRRRVSGVRYLDTTTRVETEVAAHRVIVCAGAYETPKLLLLSADPVNWPHGLGNDHDQVGRYIVTHSMLTVRGTYRPNDKPHWLQEYDFPTLMSRSWDTPEHQQRGKVFLFKDRRVPGADLAAMMIAGKSRAQIDKDLRLSRFTELQAFIEEKGQPGNRVMLGEGEGKYGLRGTTVHFDRSARVKENAQYWLGRMAQVLAGMKYSDFVYTVQDPRGDHSTGTCRMGETPEQSVTDRDLRVHEMENLYLCSNAVFPSAAAVNPTLTLTALAMRLGDHLNGTAP